MRICFLSRPDWSQIIISGTPDRTSRAGEYLPKWTQRYCALTVIAGDRKAVVHRMGKGMAVRRLAGDIPATRRGQ